MVNIVDGDIKCRYCKSFDCNESCIKSFRKVRRKRWVLSDVSFNQSYIVYVLQQGYFVEFYWTNKGLVAYYLSHPIRDFPFNSREFALRHPSFNGNLQVCLEFIYGSDGRLVGFMDCFLIYEQIGLFQRKWRTEWISVDQSRWDS